MDSEEERRVQHLLESDYNSDISIFDDSDADPNLCPPNEQNISLPDIFSPGPSIHQSKIMHLSICQMTIIQLS